MTPEVKYERIGKFIYATQRHGGDMAEMYNWMANALGLPRPGDEAAKASTLEAYLAHYPSDEKFNESFQGFLASAEHRAKTE